MKDMTAAAPSTDQASELLQKLSLDTQPNALVIPEPTKNPNANQYGSVDLGNAPNGHVPPYERSLTPVLHDFDPSMCYLPNGYPSAAYYYGGYEGTGNEWEDFTRYGNAEGVDMTSGFYGDNGSYMYHGYGFAPYGPYSPATSPVPGNEQLYGTQHYHYPTPYFQPTSVPHSPNLAPPMEVSTSSAPDQKPLSVDSVHVNANLSNNGNLKGNRGTTLKSTPYNSNGSFGRGSLPGVAAGYQDPRFAYDGLSSPAPWADGIAFTDGQPGNMAANRLNHSVSNAKSVPSSKSQNYRTNSHFMGLQQTRPLSGVGAGNGYINRMYPNRLYGQYGSTIRSGMGYGPNMYETRTAGNGWLSVGNKYRNRQYGNGFQSYGNDNMDGLNELNRGPRAKSSKNQKILSTAPLVVKGQNCTPCETAAEEKDKTSVVMPDREQYNQADLAEEYADAKFFIIKSYSEDDVHKSMKYNVWASTPNGNKKLDAAYRESQGKASGCPVFLFFSVNTSGQFVGLAEMLGPVDFHKSVDYWQQDKWNGCFPVKWHIVKDVPNSLLKHIILENNENKPVTNSRDTQEVKLEQGLKMVKIFKDHSSKTCLLDDFEFYENRQKAIQEKKAKQHQYQKLAWEGKVTNEKKDVTNVEVKPQESVEAASDLNNDTVTANGRVTDDEQNTDFLDKVIANGVANTC